jgi:hypothetical protein
MGFEKDLRRNWGEKEGMRMKWVDFDVEVVERIDLS